MDLLHFQWVRDCVERNQFLPVGDYILPTGCCAFSGFNIFPARYTGNGTGSLTISTSAGGSKHAVNRDKMRYSLKNWCNSANFILCVNDSFF